MAMPTPVNDQITDAVTQSNVTVVAEAPAMALGLVYQAMSHSIGIALENAVAHQQNGATIAHAVTAAAARAILGEEVPETGK